MEQIIKQSIWKHKHTHTHIHTPHREHWLAQTLSVQSSVWPLTTERKQEKPILTAVRLLILWYVTSIHKREKSLTLTSFIQVIHGLGT